MKDACITRRDHLEIAFHAGLDAGKRLTLLAHLQEPRVDLASHGGDLLRDLRTDERKESLLHMLADAIGARGVGGHYSRLHRDYRGSDHANVRRDFVDGMGHLLSVNGKAESRHIFSLDRSLRLTPLIRRRRRTPLTEASRRPAPLRAGALLIRRAHYAPATRD